MNTNLATILEQAKRHQSVAEANRQRRRELAEVTCHQAIVAACGEVWASLAPFAKAQPDWDCYGNLRYRLRIDASAAPTPLYPLRLCPHYDGR